MAKLPLFVILVVVGVSTQQAVGCHCCCCCCTGHQDDPSGSLILADHPSALSHDGAEGRLKKNEETSLDERIMVCTTVPEEPKLSEKVFPALKEEKEEKTVETTAPSVEKSLTSVPDEEKVVEKIEPFEKEKSNTEPEKEEKTQKITETLPGNKTKEVLVTEKKEKLSSGETVKATSVTSKNITDEGEVNVEKETIIEKEIEKDVCPLIKEEERGTEKMAPIEKEKVVVVEKVVPSLREETIVEKEKSNTEPEKEEKTQKITETLPGNMTKEVFVTEKKEKLSSGKTVKATFVTSKNITDEGEVNVKKESVIEKEIEKDVCPLIKEEERGTEKVVEEFAKESQVIEIVPLVKAEKVVPSDNRTIGSAPQEGEKDETAVPAVVKEIVTEEKVTEKDGSVIKESKVVQKAAPSVKENKTEVVQAPKEETVVEKTAPVVKETVTETEKVPVETVTEKVVPSLKEKIVSVPEEGEKVSETVVPVTDKETVTEEKVTEKDGSIVKETKIIEKAAPSMKDKEEKVVPIPKVERIVPALKEVETESNVTGKVLAEKVVDEVIPSVSETVGSVPKEGEKVETAVPHVKKEIVTEEKLTEKDGSVIKETKVVEKAAPSVENEDGKIVLTPKAEEMVTALKEVETKSNVTGKVPIEKVVPSGNETAGSFSQEGEKVIKTHVPAVKKEIVTEEKVTEKDGSIVKETKVVKKAAPSVKEKGEKVVSAPKVKKPVSSIKKVETEGNITGKVPVEKTAEKKVPSVKEKSLSVPKREEKVAETVDPDSKKEIVAEENTNEEGGSTVTEKRNVEKTAPALKETLTAIPKQEAKMIEKGKPAVKAETFTDKAEKAAQINIPSIKEKSATLPEGKEPDEKVIPVPSVKVEGEKGSPGQIKRTVVIADAVAGDPRPGPFKIVKDVRAVKVSPVLKSGDKIVQVLPPVTKEEVIMETITPVTRVDDKFIPRGSPTVLKPPVVTSPEEKAATAPQTPKAQKVKRVVKVVKAVPVVKRGDQVIKTLPPIIKEEVVSEQVVPAGEE